MRRPWLILSLLSVLGARLHAAESAPLPAAADTEDVEPPNPSEAAEETGIIPRSVGRTVSAQPITPISQFPEKSAYDQSLVELDQAETLANFGDHEAASDLALQAYDDLCTIHIRRPKKKRRKLQAQRYQAATLYMRSSVAYIRDFVQSAGRTNAAIEEGRARLGDLKDVAHDYPDLTHWFNRLVEGYPGSLNS